jgi:FkbM family methyltransferase
MKFIGKLAVWAARNWPFANGSGRIIDQLAREVELGGGEKVVWTNDDFEINILSDDLIGRHIALTGQFDRSIIQVLLNHSRPGDVLLDIGANIGYVSCVFLTRIKNGTVLCVDPQPGIVELLAKNLARFPGRARFEQIALSDNKGTVPFKVNPKNRGASRIVAEPDAETVLVPQMPAHELLAQMERVDLIKVDVEGLELPIFQSMGGELARLRPRAILFEDQARNAAPDSPIGSILSGQGYQIFGIKKQLWRTLLVPIRSQSDCTYNDYIATRSAT